MARACCDYEWQGSWRDEPPFRAPAFVMTHNERPSFALSDSTFHFVDGDPATVVQRARDAAQGCQAQAASRTTCSGDDPDV